MRERFLHFWKIQPALLIGCALLLGGAMAFAWHWSLLIPFALLLWSSPSALKSGLILLCFFSYTKILYPTPNFTDVEGIGHFCISSLKIQQSPFNRSYLYTGILKSFTSQQGHQAHNIPCRVYFPLKQERPLADRDYYIKGSIKEGQFKADKKSPWSSIPKTFSLAEKRFQAKKIVNRYLKQHLRNPQVASFLATLTTGDVDERMLSFEFGKLGLQHILAISGFHFGLLALFLGAITRLIFSLKTSVAILLLLLTAYFIFIGNSPSVQRAWIALTVLLVGYLLHLRCSALNAMGVALIVELLLDPLCLKHMGFQLSFSATAALLFLYQPFNQLLKKILPARPLNILVTMTPLHQHGYLLSAFLRKSLALNLAVHLFTLPILFFLFHKFPLLSILYNLFFPCWVGLSLLLLLLSIPFPFLHILNNGYTSLLLEITSRPPALLNYFLYSKQFSFPLLILLLSGLFITSVWVQPQKQLR